MLPESNQYIEEIKYFLQKMRNEIETITKPISNNDLPAIDKYLYEVNSFYYRSFNTRFMPVYERKIEQQIAGLLNINLQENIIKKDLTANIKRYAQLYNRVKTLTALLIDCRSEINSHLLIAINEQEQLTTELLYDLKQLQDGLEQLHNMVKSLLKLLQDKNYLSHMVSSPIYVHAVQVMSVMDFHNQQTAKSWNLFLLNLELIKNLLNKLNNFDNTQTGQTIINEINININNFKKITFLKDNFAKDLMSPLISHMELINLYLEKGKTSRVSELAAELSEWLSKLLLVLNLTPAYLTKLDPDLLVNLVTLRNPLDNNLIANIEKQTAQALSAVINIVKELVPAREPDFVYFSTQAQQIIEQYYSYFYKLGNNQNIKNCGILYSALNLVTTDLSLLEGKISLLTGKHDHGQVISAELLTIVNMLDNYLNLLSNTRADLERLLAPRNLNRTWKDISIRIERLPLEKGQIFPFDYRHILDKFTVETRLTNDPDMTILHEEGDIFIIRIDDIVEEEVPYFIISMKG